MVRTRHNRKAKSSLERELWHIGACTLAALRADDSPAARLEAAGILLTQLSSVQEPTDADKLRAGLALVEIFRVAHGLGDTDIADGKDVAAWWRLNRGSFFAALHAGVFRGESAEDVPPVYLLKKYTRG